MQPRELQHLSRSVVPGTGAIDIQPLRAGMVNETYRVIRDGATYALRVAGANPRHLGLDREWEAGVLTAAAARALAPPLV